MTLAAKTLAVVLDTFQKKEGIWKCTTRISYSQLYKSLESSLVCFAEWDPERGLYYLDFSGLEDDAPTADLLMLDFSGVQGNDHYRFEWTAAGRLGGVELQTMWPVRFRLCPKLRSGLSRTLKTDPLPSR